MVEGARVNVHVISALDWDVFRKAGGRLLNGRFRFDYPEFQALEATQGELSGRVLEGAYFVIVENPMSATGTPERCTVRVIAGLRS